MSHLGHRRSLSDINITFSHFSHFNSHISFSHIFSFLTNILSLIQPVVRFFVLHLELRSSNIANLRAHLRDVTIYQLPFVVSRCFTRLRHCTANDCAQFAARPGPAGLYNYSIRFVGSLLNQYICARTRLKIRTVASLARATGLCRLNK